VTRRQRRAFIRDQKHRARKAPKGETMTTTTTHRSPEQETRATRIDQAMRLYEPEEPVDEPFKRYLLVEALASDDTLDDEIGAYWMTTHDASIAAIVYSEGTESETGFRPYLLVDLDTGKQWDPVRTTTWQPSAVTLDEAVQDGQG
jgi:hypothetical protein